jgi:hypothetical protein
MEALMPMNLGFGGLFTVDYGRIIIADMVYPFMSSGNLG